MRFYFHQTPWVLKQVYRSCTWQRKHSPGKLFLTFDDGPQPEATPYVLDLLDQYEAKATFFVVGEHIAKHREIFKSVVNRGHSIGNHTYHHLSGWNTSCVNYLQNVDMCQKEIELSGYHAEFKPLFRPPYGRLRFDQLSSLTQGYELIMWEYISGDFDPSLNSIRSRKILCRAKEGDIVLFHDNPKHLQNLKALLPGFLDHFSRLGYTFAAL